MGNSIKLFVSIFFGTCFYQSAFAEENNSSIQSFIDKSVEIKLHENSSWHDLMHYRANLLSSGYTSQADSKNFFFDVNGKHNPEAELQATLRAMFKPIALNKSDEHPQCLFIARKNWLRSKLPGLEFVLPKVNCAEYKKWINSINPNSVTLVFPAAYINNPGSMFGHTLLRINPPPTNQKSVLTSYAITYAAKTNETNGLAFALKGLAGGYPGLFSILPYYDKVNEYNDIENRDIWEYELDLIPAETTRLLQHMWELRNTVFDYYFFDENCSYQLLALLDVARPGLNLAAEFPAEVIPVDTVRAIQDKKLITSTLYRPSLLTNLSYQLEQYSGQNLKLIMDLVHGIESPSTDTLKSLTDKNQIHILEIAYNYLQYLYKSNEVSRPTYAKQSLILLKARNKLDPTINLPDAPQPAIRPEQGHRSSRMSYSIGTKSKTDFIELGWRPAYHDLLDNNDGFVDGLQINFLDVSVRFDSDKAELALHEINFLNIYSLKPRTRFFKPSSWKFSINYSRLPLLEDNDRPVFNINGGGGLSYQPFESLRVYGLIETTLLIQHRLKNSTSIAFGPNLGFLWQTSPNWKIWFDSSIQYYDSHNDLTYQKFELGQSYSVSKNMALRLLGTKKGNKEDLQNELKISLYWYF